jgi:rhamnogalacturonyl hydrolase YesR
MTYTYNLKSIGLFVLAFFLVGSLIISQSFAQDPDVIPSWIKNNAGWWAADQIDDYTFAQGIGFLIKNKIIQISDLPTTADGDIIIKEDIVIPSWIKNNAGWWANDNISDSDFLYGIKYLVESNIIEFQSENIEQYILDWDTIVSDSKYAHDGSIRLQNKFFDYVDYTVKYNAADNHVYDTSEPTLLGASVWLYMITGNEQFLQNAGHVADVIEETYLYESGIVMKAHPISNTVMNTEKHTNKEILCDVAKLALVDPNYAQLTKTLADAVIEHEINHETELFYSGVTLEGEPLDRSMYMSYGGATGLESLLLAYEVTSDNAYLEQVKRTILAYWDLRDKETDLIPSWVNTDTPSVKEPFMQQYGAGIFLKVLLHYYYLTEDAEVYKIIEDYTDAVVDHFWDGKTWNYRVDYDGEVRSDIIEANYGKLDDALFLVYDLNPTRFQKAYNLAKSDYDFSFQEKITMTNGLAIHAVKDDGSPASHESMMTYAFLINQNPAVRLYQDTMEPEYIEYMKDFYEKVILHHKREFGYIYGINAYTLEDTPLGVNLNQYAIGMIGNKINLSFIPSENVNIVWTKIGNFEIMQPFIVHFNEPGRFNAINFDYNDKSIFFEAIENHGTVTFSGVIKSVLVDGQNYSNFNGKILNTLEGKHNYKVTLVN